MRAPENLNTDRLHLRPITRSDAEDIFHLYAGKALPTHFMPFKTHGDVSESRAFAMRCQDCWRSGAAFPWAVTERATGRVLGNVELKLSPPQASIGYIFGEAFWGQGFASEAACAVVEWAIAQPEIYRVWATCHPDNLGSAAVLRKAGLDHEATLANWEARPQLGEVAGPSHMYARIKPTTA
ncbi:GNAT family N-acetyltransferase [Brevundimonas sp.]|uniref:GNAT family N-acetyltransferase n=1 Tax=Brevundimonas sp. TaxID=1871086 RepID=UPI0025C132A8|nr:GNAT family N-acetyltransferase [Brevundimonas sp.]